MNHIKWGEFKFGIFFFAIQILWLLAYMYRFVASGGIDYEALGTAIVQGLLVVGLLVPNKYGLYTTCLILFSNIPATIYLLGAGNKTLTAQEFWLAFVWAPILLRYLYKRKHWWAVSQLAAISGPLEAAPSA